MFPRRGISDEQRVLCRAGDTSGPSSPACIVARVPTRRTSPHVPVSRSPTLRAALCSAVGMPCGSGLITESENTLAFGMKTRLRKCVT